MHPDDSKPLRGKVLLIDGHNFLFRGYYGVPIVAQLNNTPVNAIYGFFALIRNYIKVLQPSHIIIVFDTENGTSKKLKLQPNYKATRSNDYGNIFQQLEVIKKLLDILNYT